MSEEAQLILVVDDDLFIRKSNQRLLKILGYPSISAGDGREGIALLEARREEIGLVILDLFMPVMSGGEALQRIRQLDPRLPVLITSGHDRSEVELPFLDDGYTEFLQKPVTPEDLSSTLMRLLPQKGSR